MSIVHYHKSTNWQHEADRFQADEALRLRTQYSRQRQHSASRRGHTSDMLFYNPRLADCSLADSARRRTLSQRCDHVTVGDLIEHLSESDVNSALYYDL